MQDTRTSETILFSALDILNGYSISDTCNVSRIRIFHFLTYSFIGNKNPYRISKTWVKLKPNRDKVIHTQNPPGHGSEKFLWQLTKSYRRSTRLIFIRGTNDFTFIFLSSLVSFSPEISVQALLGLAFFLCKPSGSPSQK